MDLEDLEIYKIAVKISDLAWEIYQELPREFRFKTGQQFLSASDSIGANIAEGFGRFHYKDSMKIYLIREVLYLKQYTGQIDYREEILYRPNVPVKCNIIQQKRKSNLTNSSIQLNPK